MNQINYISILHEDIDATPIFGYIKKVGNRWAVFGWENEHNEQKIGDEYTNIDAAVVCRSIDQFGLREGPICINWWDCRIDKRIRSVFKN